MRIDNSTVHREDAIDYLLRNITTEAKGITMRNQIREVLSAKKQFFIIIPILMNVIILSFSLVVSVYYTAQSFSHVSYSDGYAIYDAYGVETVSEFFSDESAMNEELKKQNDERQKIT